MSSEHSWDLVAANNEKLWERTGQSKIDVEIMRRKYGWIGHSHSTKKSKRNLPQRTRMEPARKEITWTPQSHLEAHCFGGMRENII
jgi:hypothetical protein